ncbi:MAG: hypothetical protein IPN96_23665 [Anaerolineales bacterium]|nr:hypothetical protein [Anaerolineales bacterium]
MIENEEQRSNSRFGGIDQQTGFISRALMAVPLQVKIESPELLKSSTVETACLL